MGQVLHASAKTTHAINKPSGFMPPVACPTIP